MAKSKKELDKDLMFSKIMPAIVDNPFSNDAKEAASNEVENEDSLSVLRDKIFKKCNNYSKTESFTTINITENLVLDNVDEVIHRFNACSCDRCRCDICAYALNLLPVNYVVAPPAKLSELESNISEKEIIDALVKAVLKVRAHPHH